VSESLRAARRLGPERLRSICDPGSLGFATTADVPPLRDLVGQARAIEAIEFALSFEDRRYNAYVAGPSGTGKMTTTRRLVEIAASSRPAPSDWCYLHCFADPYRPVAVELPAGRGPELAKDLAALVARCKVEIPRAFDSEEGERRRGEVAGVIGERRERVLSELARTAHGLGFGIQVSQMGIATTPVDPSGEPIGPEAFAALSPEQRAQIEESGEKVQRAIGDAIPALRKIERDGQDLLLKQDLEVVLFAVGHLFDSLAAKYVDQHAVVEHLAAIRADLLDHMAEVRAGPPQLPAGLAVPSPWDRYEANVVVTNAPGGGAPVVFESNPTFANLVGRIDFRVGPAAAQTDYRLIQGGALHRANGGFLIIEARDLVTSPFAYDAVKRALRDGEIRIETPSNPVGGVPTSTLKPAPIPLRLRVLLVGESGGYVALLQLDEDFGKLFPLKAEFTPVIERTPAAQRQYAAFVSARVAQHGLRHFTAAAVARIIELGGRLVAHQERLAARFDEIERIVVEADRWARVANAATVDAAHVDQALEHRERRASLPEEEMQRSIDEGTLIIHTRGKVIGQVNGLAVLDTGDRAFGRPTRITARSGMGTEGVVDITREAALSGPTHSKGVLTIAGYLLGAYGRRHPLPLTAHLSFEQSYGPVEGDSASSAELFALLSSLAEVPIDQSIAVTGSVDQRGVIQAIGGVNEKIEGHFAVCKTQGLTGEQGVIIPASNVRHLMLDREVVAAVAEGRFHVWSIETIDQGIELLTGVPAGERTSDDAFTPGTIHAMVTAKLDGFARQLAERRP